MKKDQHGRVWFASFLLLFLVSTVLGSSESCNGWRGISVASYQHALQQKEMKVATVDEMGSIYQYQQERKRRVLSRLGIAGILSAAGYGLYFLFCGAREVIRRDREGAVS